MSESSPDHDSPWKEALQRHFRPATALWFPRIHAEIDWTRPPTFLDKEIQQIVRDARMSRRYADKLVGCIRATAAPPGY